MNCKFVSLNNMWDVLNFFNKNIHKYPLIVRKSLINEAGLGVFATGEIQANTLIGTYTGAVGTHMDTDVKSNSLFDYGVF